MAVRWEPLPREEVIKAVERKSPMQRIPLIRAKWWGEGLSEQYGEALQELERYPEDSAMIWVAPFDVAKMGLSWDMQSGGAHDAACVIDDYAKLDEFIEKLPDPENDPQFEALLPQAEKARAQNIYLFFGWWNLFFEKPWSLRGMQNLMLDYYVDPENVRRMHKALSDQYRKYISFCVDAFTPDAFWTSDDLGHQTQPMMSPQIFHELIFPYYQQVGETISESNIHWWLHSCGNNTPLMDDLVAAGLDVFHPVQKGTMDEQHVAKEYGDKLTFLAGIDVQHILQEKSPDEVRREVRFLIDTFDRQDGGMCIAAGNGIVSGTPYENIEAFLEESVEYGRHHRQQYI